MTLSALQEVRVDMSDWTRVILLQSGPKFDWDETSDDRSQKTRKSDGAPGFAMDFFVQRENGESGVISFTWWGEMPEIAPMTAVKLVDLVARPWGTAGKSGLWWSASDVKPLAQVASAPSSRRMAEMSPDSESFLLREDFHAAVVDEAAPVDPSESVAEVAALTALLNVVHSAQTQAAAAAYGQPANAIPRKDIASALGIHENNLRPWLSRRRKAFRT